MNYRQDKKLSFLQKNNSAKKGFSMLGLIILLVLSQIIIVKAQSQTGTLTIMPGSIFFQQQPGDFTFPRNFVPLTSQIINSYATLEPEIYNNTLIVYDGDSTSGFDITLALDDLESNSMGNNIIHYTDIALVTLSSSLIDPVDSGDINTPPGAPNVTAPLNCNWNPIIEPNMEIACNTSMTSFSEPLANATSLANDVSPSDIVIGVTDGSQLSNATPLAPRKIIIDGDIILYTGKTVNQLTGVSNINESHLTNDVVKQYYDSSQQITIMSNSVISDRGIYSFGFGFRLTYNESTIPDNYNSTLTFTLIPIP